MADWNNEVIAEFRDNGGKVGGELEGASLLLLHSVGANSGQDRVSPVNYQPAPDGGWYVFAAFLGLDTNPAWYHNLTTHPDASVEVGRDGEVAEVAVSARELTEVEREPVWARQKSEAPRFAEYEERTDRVIPVLHLSPR